MKLWVVLLQIDYEGDEVKGVFDTPERAQEIRDLYEKEWEGWAGITPKIRKFRLNELGKEG